MTNEGNAPFQLLNASSPTEVKVLGIEIDLPSAERRRTASAVVKTGILEGEGKNALVNDQRYININISRNREPDDI